MWTRSADWLKIKKWHELDAVIMGYRTEPQFGMVVGVDDGQGLRPVATVELGFKPTAVWSPLEGGSRRVPTPPG